MCAIGLCARLQKACVDFVRMCIGDGITSSSKLPMIKLLTVFIEAANTFYKDTPDTKDTFAAIKLELDRSNIKESLISYLEAYCDGFSAACALLGDCMPTLETCLVGLASMSTNLGVVLDALKALFMFNEALLILQLLPPDQFVYQADIAHRAYHCCTKIPGNDAMGLFCIWLAKTTSSLVLSPPEITQVSCIMK